MSRPGEYEPELGIWKHKILDAAGNPGNRELVLDWSRTGMYAESTFYDMTFATDGTLIIATDNADPLMTLSPDGTQDVYYQGIVAPEARFLKWGNGTCVSIHVFLLDFADTNPYI